LALFFWIANITGFVETLHSSPVLSPPGAHARAICERSQVQKRENHLVNLSFIVFHGSLTFAAVSIIPALCQRMALAENGRQAYRNREFTGGSGSFPTRRFYGNLPEPRSNLQGSMSALALTCSFSKSCRYLLPLFPTRFLCGARRHALAIDRGCEGKEGRGARYLLAIFSSYELPCENSDPDRRVRRQRDAIDAEGWRIMDRKSGPSAEIAQEAAALRWCEGRLPVAHVLDERPGVLEMSWLPGCPVSDLSADLACAVLVEALRQIHAPLARCTLIAEWGLRLREAEERVRTGLVDESDFDDANLGRSPESILAELRSLPPVPKHLCFTHCDGTLENFLAQDGKLSGIVDMSRSGIAHPAQDWALALRSVRQRFGPEGERQFRGHIPPNCAELSLLRRFCLLDELF
jgi:aminoglycoside 3'-phosphotransferase II